MRSNKMSKIIKVSCILGVVFVASGCSNAKDTYKEMRVANICENYLMSQGDFIKAQSFSNVRQEKSRVVDEHMKTIVMENESEAKEFMGFMQEYDRFLGEMSKAEIENFYVDNC